jgi:hypothetical protein
MGLHHSGLAGFSGVTRPAPLRQFASNEPIEPLDPIFGVTEKSVIMLDIRSDWLAELRRLFMSLGVEVFYGPDGAGIGSAPLLLVDKEGHRRSKARGYIDYVQAMHPGASLCIVMGGAGSSGSSQAAPVAQDDDARALLAAAGVSFISDMEI